MSMKRSPIWQYFEVNSENNKFAICLLCGLQISRGGEGKKAGTSAMSNHLKSKHQETYLLLHRDKVNNVPTPLVVSVDPSTSSFSTSREQQRAFSKSFERKLFWDEYNAKAKKYNYLVAEMIALDNEPLSIVERVRFTRLLQQALPSYELPSRTFITETLFPDIYNRIFEKIRKSISNAAAVSVTSDIWTCLENESSILSFTAHWLSPEFQLQHGVLSVKPFSGSHTGENVANELNAIASRWDIDKNKIHVLVHNSFTDMVKGVRIAEYDSARCFIYSLHRAVTESLKIQSEVMDMIAEGRRLVNHFNHSFSAQEKLLAIQKQLSLPEHQLVQDINTRWNSTFYMVERLLEQKTAISLYVAVHDTLTDLTTHQWWLMEQYVQLLKPFEEITKITSSGISCISEVIPHVAALKKYLDKDETVKRTADLPHIRACLKAELESHYRSLSEDPNYFIATFLDPRFKTNYLGPIEAERARNKILYGCIKMSGDESSDNSIALPTPAKLKRGNETDSNDTLESHNIFWNCFNEVADENKSQYRDQEKNPIEVEVDYYLMTVRIDRSDDPYYWWSVNSQQYPHMTKFAKVYLSAPCSSVYREKLFSEAGLLNENKRNRMLPTDAENLVFIHYNLPLVNFEY